MGKPNTEPPFFYKLVKPLLAGDGPKAERIETVKIKKRPALKDLRKIYKHTDRFDRLACALERLTDLEAGAIEELDYEDVKGLGEAIAPFFEDGEDSGEEVASSIAAPSA